MVTGDLKSYIHESLEPGEQWYTLKKTEVHSYHFTGFPKTKAMYYMLAIYIFHHCITCTASYHNLQVIRS